MKKSIHASTLKCLGHLVVPEAHLIWCDAQVGQAAAGLHQQQHTRQHSSSRSNGNINRSSALEVRQGTSVNQILQELQVVQAL